MINVSEMKSTIIQQALEGKIINNNDFNDSRVYLSNNKITYHEDGPHSIPNNWCWVKCKDVCKLLGGFAFKSEKYTDANDAVRVIRISDFNNDRLLDNEIKKYPYSSELDPYEIYENDILMCMTGGTVGKICLFPNVSYKCYLNQRVALFRTKHLNIHYLFYVLKSSQILKIISDTKRSTNDNISMKIIGDFDIPFPSIEEQNAIVSKLDEIFSELDKVESNQNKLVAIQNKLQSKILKLAIQGKLVEQRAEEGTGVDLLKLLGINNYKHYDLSDEPFDIPESWVWCKLSDIGTTNIGLTYHPEDIVDNGTMVIRSSNIVDGKLDFKDKVCVNCSIKPNQYLNDTDIIICSRNGSKNLVGKNTIYRGENNVYSFGAFMAIFRTQFYEYVHLYFNSDAFKRYFNSDDSKQINQVTQAILKDSLIPLPPLKEQIRIVEKYNELISTIKSI